MTQPTRLERLRKLVQADIDALSDRPIQEEPEPASDDGSPGGVVLEPEQSSLKPLLFDSNPIVANKADHSITSAPISSGNSDHRFVWVKEAESSYNPKTAPMPQSALPKTAKLSVTNLKRGDLASPRHHFTPILALAKYPYKFCDRAHSQDITSAFFDQGKFWEREWDLYYVWNIEPDTKPVILVCESQVHTLLGEINTHLNLNLKVTDQQREEGLVAHFPDHPRCVPRYLGRSQSRQEYDNMAGNAPSHTYRAPGEKPHPELEPDTHEMFRQLMSDLNDAQKSKSKAARAKKQQDRLSKQKTMADHFKRAQRYLGLRPSFEDAPNSLAESTAVDVTAPTPCPFDRSVVFVCVDVESFERDHTKITEVGIATLDTRDLVNIAPGADGVEWSKKIRARHFRINEYRHLVNRDFVCGYPDKFRFGNSTFVSLKEAAQHVSDCFHAPFGAHDSNGAGNTYTLAAAQLDTNEQRNLIFLGHDTSTDIQYLRKLGFDPTKMENIVEALDTAIMYRVWRREQQPTSLSKILMSFDLDGFYAHNAGNDAVFTIQAMLATCVREATLRGSAQLEKQRNEEAAARLEVVAEEAIANLKLEEEKWAQLERDGDGGGPVSLAASDSAKAAPAQKPSEGAPHYNSADMARGQGRGQGRGRGDSRGGRGSLGTQRRGGQYEGSNRSRDGNTHGSGQRGRARERGSEHSRGRGYGIRGRPAFDSNAPAQPSSSRPAPQVGYPDLL